MNDQHSYETGSTRPPKSHRGLIAVLLAAVIVLCGISTALGLMNIRLTLALQNQEQNNCGVAFSATQEPAPSESMSISDKNAQPALGLRGQALTEPAQRFYSLPPGFWVMEVIPGGPAEEAGLQQGDILLSIDDQTVTDAESIRTLLAQYAPGDTVLLRIFRGNADHEIPLTLAESE